MRVAIVSINYRPELTGISVYTTGLAEGLVKAGDEVDVYTAFPYYPQWRKSQAHQWLWFWREDIEGVRVRRHYLYVPSRPSALRRMVHELSFVFSATIGYFLGPRADVTMIVSPSLFLGIPISLLAKLKGSPTLFHVQDLQPDAAVDLGMLKPGRLTNLFYRIERLTYRLCNRISTISDGMLRRVVDKGVPREKITLLRNWANDELIHQMSSDTDLRREWGLDGKFVVLYSGNMGVKQGLGSVLACAERLKEERDIAFVIVGDGGEKHSLMAQAKALELANVHFQSLQSMQRLGELLATANVSVIPQKTGVADIVLPSKLANIMASGRPVVASAAEGTELCRIVHDAQCGFVVPQGDVEGMATAIRNLRNRTDLCAELGRNGRAYMEAHLGHSLIMAQFRSELRQLAFGEAPDPVTVSGN